MANIATSAPQAKGAAPEVHPDRTITFRFRDVNAKSVIVSLSDQNGPVPIPMTRDAGGVWSGTTPPLAPDRYSYVITSDGETRLDPNNPITVPNLIWQGNAITVPGTPPEAWEVQNVPHGTVHHHFYHSDVSGDDRDFYVYTPPSYESSRRKRYPALFLLHGFSDMAGGWTDVGQAHVILDNLIAQGKILDMVVVMPLGYGLTDFASPNRSRNSDRARLNEEGFRKGLFTEVMPRAERQYRLLKGPKNTAIAGLSMGGGETLDIGINYPGTFGYVGGMSSAIPGKDAGSAFPNVDATNLNPQIKLLWIACGTSDGLIKPNREAVKYLQDKGVKVEPVETVGAHTWMVWRRNLIEFTQKLFRG